MDVLADILKSDIHYKHVFNVHKSQVCPSTALLYDIRNDILIKYNTKANSVECDTLPDDIVKCGRLTHAEFMDRVKSSGYAFDINVKELCDTLCMPYITEECIVYDDLLHADDIVSEMTIKNHIKAKSLYDSFIEERSRLCNRKHVNGVLKTSNVLPLNILNTVNYKGLVDAYLSTYLSKTHTCSSIDLNTYNRATYISNKIANTHVLDNGTMLCTDIPIYSNYKPTHATAQYTDIYKYINYNVGSLDYTHATLCTESNDVKVYLSNGILKISTSLPVNISNKSNVKCIPDIGMHPVKSKALIDAYINDKHLSTQSTANRLIQRIVNRDDVYYVSKDDILNKCLYLTKDGNVIDIT